MSSGVRIHFILVVFKFYTPNTGTSAAHRVSGSHCALLLWFRKLTIFTHTLISCIRAEGARQSAICARRKKNPPILMIGWFPLKRPSKKTKWWTELLEGLACPIPLWAARRGRIISGRLAKRLQSRFENKHTQLLRGSYWP